MRRLFLTFLLAGVSGCAVTEWVKVDSNRYQTLYADLASKQKDGDLVKIWQLIDFARPAQNLGLTFLSAKAQVEFDCTKMLIRTLIFTWHSKNMAEGEVLYTSSDAAFNARFNMVVDPDHWGPVKSWSLDGSLLRLLCAE